MTARMAEFSGTFRSAPTHIISYWHDLITLLPQQSRVESLRKPDVVEVLFPDKILLEESLNTLCNTGFLSHRLVF